MRIWLEYDTWIMAMVLHVRMGRWLVRLYRGGWSWPASYRWERTRYAACGPLCVTWWPE